MCTSSVSLPIATIVPWDIHRYYRGYSGEVLYFIRKPESWLHGSKFKVKCKPAYQRLTVFRQDREHFHNRKNRTHKATPHMVFGRPQANEWTYHLSLFANSNEDIDLIAEMQTPPLQKNLQEFRTKLRKSHHFDIRMPNISCFHTRKCEAKQLLIETKNTRLYRFQWEVGLQLLLIYRVVLFLY